jgi:hypothetical protein
MGQQQLLLVILVTIIVGIATVVAINIFGQAADQANRDAVRQDLMGAAAQAQGIWARPEMMGGAAREFNGTALSAAELLAALNIPVNDPTYVPGTSTTAVNDNGSYIILANSASSLTITGSPSSGGDDIQAIVCRDATTGNWLIDIDSPTATEPAGCSEG